VSIIEELVGSYGYLAVAGIVGGESMGLPLPGESVLIAAGAYAGATHHLSVAVVFLTAAVAAVVGDNVGFWVGRRFGPRLLAHAQRRGGARQRHLQAVLRLYARHGGSVVVVGRYVSVVRTYAAFGAGAAGMGAGRFVVLNAAGGTAWAAVFGFGSAALGATVGTTLTYALAGVALVAAAGTGLALSRRGRRRSARALVPDPGAARAPAAAEPVTCSR